MLPLHSSSARQVNTVPGSQALLHSYSHVWLALQTHSPGQRSGAFSFGQSQLCWQGPP